MRVREPPEHEDGSVRSDFISEFPLEDIDPDLRAKIELLDFGCGVGDSLTDAARRFGVPSVGLDFNPHKVRRARRKNLPAYAADVTTLEVGDFPALRFVNLDNVLEHMPNAEDAEVVVRRACQLASSAVHIRHPSFEDEEYLAGLGLKLFWNDWPTAHSAHIRLHDFVAMAERAGVYRLLIQPVLRIRDAANTSVLPLSAPVNQRRIGKGQGAYNPEVHDPKPDITFDRPVYYAFDLLLVTGQSMPTLVYPGDPDESPARPTFIWPDPPSAAESPAPDDALSSDREDP